MRNSISTKKTALCGILCALSVALMFLGSIIEILDLTSAAIASFFVYVVFLGCGKKWSVSLYASTALISNLLLTGKLAPLSFVFIGIYPVFKGILEKRIKSKTLLWFLKLLVFNVFFAVFILLFKQLLFTSEFLENGFLLIYLISFAFGNLYIVLFDLACKKVFLIFNLLFGRYFY